MKPRLKPLHMMPKDPTECVKEWRGLFHEAVLKKAMGFLTLHQYEDFACTEREAHAIIGQGAAMGRALIRGAPTCCSEDWDPSQFSCSCQAGASRHGDEDALCVHEAALLLLWERRRGPWRFRETREESRARVRKEAEARRMEEERVRRKQRRETEGAVLTDAAPFFTSPESSGAYFQVRRAVTGRQASLYALHRAEELFQEGVVDMEPPRIVYDAAGQQALSVTARVCDALDNQRVRVMLSPRELLSCLCDCHAYDDDRDSLCEHALCCLRRVQEYIDRENPGDATDRAAEQFFRAMEDSPRAAPNDSDAGSVRAPKDARIVLFPRVTMDMGEPKLSFKAGWNQKFVILRNPREFVEAAEAERVLTLSRTVRADFSKMTLTEESQRWFAFLRQRVREADFLNERLKSSWAPSVVIDVPYQDALSGAALDRFYDTANGTSCELSDRKRKWNGMIHVGHKDMKIRLASQRLAGADGAFLGLAVTGVMPFLLESDVYSYALTEQSLSRLTKEESDALQPFRAAANASGDIRFLVGRDKLAEFYYRVVPRLLKSPYVEFTDRCAEEAETVLPPEPAFLFRLDLEGDCLLELFVSYGDSAPRRLPRTDNDGAYFDAAQEARVERVIRRYFPRYDEKTRTWRGGGTDEELYRILTEGVIELSRYGETQGSDAFRRCAARSTPQIHVGVSVESGLLDISILSEDISPRELLEVLDSYRRKKTFHRLKNGEFLNLRDDSQFASLDAMMKELNLSAEEVVRGHIELPLFRALYLDAMLEKHQEFAANRDRTYRALIRNFHTIRDADYEVPAAQSGILRPYQVYGYKWLRTLCASGFGGILADEMGLGKTVQAITFLQALKESGETAPSLIVCPASLVYNWQEEFGRFAPSMTVVPVAGAAAVRKRCLSDAASGRARVDAYITSYDLLRQDIADYEPLSFSVMILDEAQYIKNQKAGMTKAVKVVRARRRLALTGTPIENRLAELWSIFDFLMPGFLYSYPEFLRKFETPITKNKDPDAAARLKRMTAPFILRRLKADVLKDLPPKLEEVRYTRFGTEQRKLYDGQVVRMKRMIERAGPSGEERIRIFAELMRIRQICCDPSLVFEDYRGGSAKRAACMELVQSAMEGGHRALIFSQFASMLALLEEDFQKAKIPCYKITGATPKEQRFRLVRAFNEDRTPVFLISLKAGGTGLNLTGADMVVHYDPWWNLAAQNQATDRAHRIGQKNQVTVYRMIVKGSIEEKILSMQEAKRDLADAILSGESESLFTLSNEDLLELLE